MASLSPSRLFGFSPAVAKPRTGATPLFAVTVFVSAGLVFLVEPMIGKLLLPLLGGAPAVWNTSLAFFQVALLLGYAYAHLLQRLPSFRMQVGVHGIVLLLAALTLPLHISRVFGDPDPARPILWMLGVLTLSVGAPFAALSATAPLVQAWFALTAPRDADGKAPQPYSLYAASNLGSLLALVAYPAVIEPLTHLSSQRLGWSLGYVALAVLIMSLGLTQKVQATREETQVRTARPALARMATWVFLAAVPSSLMMGVTSYLSTDVATAPFLWVVPLALYLLTFIIAFSSKALLSSSTTLITQAIAACLCLYFIPFQGLPIPLQLSIHLLCFFLTALMCHSALSAARPEPDHLTLFYLCVSFGGVIGGSFNAFLTPVIFPTVIEYPLVVVLACLARSKDLSAQGFSREIFHLKRHEIACLAVGVIAGVIGLWLATVLGDNVVTQTAFKITCFIAIGCALVLRDRGLWMAVLLGLVAAGGQIGETGRTVHIERSFFGVSKIIDANDPVLGPVRKMVHGTTLHGAQALTPGHECQTLTYYNPSTAIGQTITGLEAHNPSMNMAIVGLGAGAMANYVRTSDRLAFFEIDPVVARLANDPKYFTFTTHCAKGPLSFHMGDARLTLAPLPTHQLDLLMVDAFSSDAVPAHLLTVESVKMYLSKVKPGGLVLFHLSNRHLELRDPVIAAIAEAGGVSLQQRSTAPSTKTVAATSSVVVIASPTAEGLATFRADPRWTTRDPGTVKAWTDDYMNLIGAMLRHKNDGK